jgi:hypothetical protein
VTHSPYARATDLTVTLSRIAVQYLTLIFHQHTEAKDVITSKSEVTRPGIDPGTFWPVAQCLNHYQDPQHN